MTRVEIYQTPSLNNLTNDKIISLLLHNLKSLFARFTFSISKVFKISVIDPDLLVLSIEEQVYRN